MKTPIAWASAILTLFVAVAIAFLLEPRVPENTPETLERSPEVEDSSKEEPKHAVGVEVELPIEKLNGQFVILENREWSYKEIAENSGVIPDRFPRTWGAGRLVKEETSIVNLYGSQSLGYIPAGWLAEYEIDALEELPEVTALVVHTDWEYSEVDIERALLLPTLTCMATTASMLERYSIPQNIHGLSVTGNPPEWNFPWVTSFESNVDYSDTCDDEIPTPLPTNLDNVEFLVIRGWPNGESLPPSVHRLDVGNLEPKSLIGATNLEWIEDVYFELSDDENCLEVFASFPWLNDIELNNGRVTDADLKALSTAKHIETLDLDIDYDSNVTANGIAALAYMPNLRSLTISGGITDKMCMGLANAPALEELTFGESFRITDSFLEVIPRLPKLRLLDIRRCDRFTGEGARFLHGLEIEIQYKFGEKLTTEGCQEVIANWPTPSLCFTFMSDHLTDDAFRGLENAHYLRKLSLRGCKLVTQQTLNRVLSLTNLETLSLPDLVHAAEDHVNDNYLLNLAELTNLTSLDIGRGKNVTERGFLAIAAMPNLKVLRIFGDKMTTRVFSELQRNQSLKSLELTSFYSHNDDPQYDGVWDLIDARPDLKVFARSKGNPYTKSKRKIQQIKRNKNKPLED